MTDPNHSGANAGGNFGARGGQPNEPADGAPASGHGGPSDGVASATSSQGDAPGIAPISVGGLLDGTVRTYLRNWRQILGVTAAVLVPLNILLFLVMPVDFLPDPGMMFAEGFGDVPVDQPPEVIAPGEILLTQLGMLLQVLIITPLLVGAVVHITGQTRFGTSVGIADAARAMARRAPALVAARFILGAIVFVASFAVSIVFVVALAGAMFAGPVAALVIVIPLGIAVGLGFAAALTPFAVVNPSIMLEGRGPIAGLGRSFALVRRRYWPTFGRVLLVWVMFFAISNALMLPIYLGAVAGPAGMLTVSTLVEILTVPIVPVALTLTYFDLRARVEGADLVGAGAWPPAPYGPPPGWGGQGQPGAWGGQPGAWGGQPGAWGQQPGAWGQQPGAWGQQPGQGQHAGQGSPNEPGSPEELGSPEHPGPADERGQGGGPAG